MNAPPGQRRAGARLLLAVCCAAVLGLAGLSSAASAATSITGANTRVGDLTIAPDTDALTTNLNATVVPNVLLIQRMPATKVVSDITLGDFGTGSCSDTTRASLIVDHLTTGRVEDVVGPGRYADNTVTLARTPARLTWSFRTPLVLSKGSEERQLAWK